jgi:hypothetical protein
MKWLLLGATDVFLLDLLIALFLRLQPSMKVLAAIATRM